jgi:hypothetical protein
MYPHRLNDPASYGHRIPHIAKRRYSADMGSDSVIFTDALTARIYAVAEKQGQRASEWLNFGKDNSTNPSQRFYLCVWQRE